MPLGAGGVGGAGAALSGAGVAGTGAAGGVGAAAGGRAWRGAGAVCAAGAWSAAGAGVAEGGAVCCCARAICGVSVSRARTVRASVERIMVPVSERRSGAKTRSVLPWSVSRIVRACTHAVSEGMGGEPSGMMSSWQRASIVYWCRQRSNRGSP